MTLYPVPRIPSENAVIIEPAFLYVLSRFLSCDGNGFFKYSNNLNSKHYFRRSLHFFLSGIPLFSFKAHFKKIPLTLK